MAKFDIPRLPDESQADFRRRYNREAMRIKRAALPKSDKVRSGDAKPRKNSPFTQAEWEALKRQAGETEREWRNRNAAARHEKYAARHPGRLKARSRQWYINHPEAEKARTQRYREENPEKVKAVQKAYYHANKERRSAAAKAWVVANPERARERARKWYAKNPGLNAFYSSKWRKAVVQATPLWANLDAILVIYQECARISAETGILHHVDHHYPLRGKRVCGLHVEENLRIVPATVNVRKHNKHPEDG